MNAAWRANVVGVPARSSTASRAYQPPARPTTSIAADAAAVASQRQRRVRRRGRARGVDQPLRQRLVQQRVEAVAQPGVLALDLGGPRGERGIARERLLERRPPLGRQLPVGPGMEVVVADRRLAHAIEVAFTERFSKG